MSAKIYVNAPKNKPQKPISYANENDVYEILKLWLNKIFTKNLPVFQGQINRVSTVSPPYIVIQTITNELLSLNHDRYTDTTKIIGNHNKLRIQFDFYGDKLNRAFNLAQKFKAFFMDGETFNFFAKKEFPIRPLYTIDNNLRPFVNAEDQWSDRFSIDAFFDYFPEFEMCQESAKELCISVIAADAN